MTLLLLAVLAAPQDPAPIPVDEYREALKNLLTSVEAGDVPGAREVADDLAKKRVRHGDITFAPDPSLTGELRGDPDESRMADLAPRIRSLIDALDDAAPAAESTPPDPDRLARIRWEEALERPGMGGDVALPEPEVPKTWSEWAVEVAENVADWLENLFEWFIDLLFPDRGIAPSASMGGAFSMGWLVTVLVILLVVILATVAILALRRGTRPEEEEFESTGSARVDPDDDPLTRSANEWERRAADLAAEGRYREAIRAWYHAILVTAFRAGILHYRRDRTNWEYASALNPGIGWRPRFLQATRDFEREWYGRRTSEAETADLFSRDARGILDELHAGRTR